VQEPGTISAVEYRTNIVLEKGTHYTGAGAVLFRR
jgi:hypothetical protein